jgi:hypothetical protein
MWAILLYGRLWKVLYKKVIKVKFTVGQAKKAQSGKKMCSFTLSLTSAIDGVGGQRHALALLPPRKRSDTQRTVGCVGLRTGRDTCGKPCPLWISTPGSPSRKSSEVN